MKRIFVNLKRFDVYCRLGGVCPVDDPVRWTIEIIDKTIEYELGNREDLLLTYFFPEALILSALTRIRDYPEEKTKLLSIGSQGVFRENIQPGGNFGAFTTNLPAAAVRNFGCAWSIIGHSEERKDKMDLLGLIDSGDEAGQREKAGQIVNQVINQELSRALESGINTLLCIGETADDRGRGGFEEQKTRVQEVLKKQLLTCLNGTEKYLSKRCVTIGYEPVWAIGPGKVPPGREYIAFVSGYIKKVLQEEFGYTFPVVYGGGLKEENAGMLSSIETIDGGLVALTKFTGDIGFEPGGLKKIIDQYTQDF